MCFNQVRIFRRPEPMPVCKTCNSEMDYWYPFDDGTSDYEHDKCRAKRWADELFAKFKTDMEEGLKHDRVPVTAV